MDLDGTARYSIDVTSPMSPVYKLEQEDAGLLTEEHTCDEPARPKGAWDPARWRRVINPLLAVFALLSTLLAIAGWVAYWRALPGLHLAGEINGLVPEFPVRPVLFEDDPLSTPDHKTAESANATYEYWASFMPVGNGFMPVQPDDKYILAPPMVDKNDDGSETQYYSIAVFHQLHCLHGIMKAWNKVNDELQQAKRGQLQVTNDNEDYHHRMVHHADHCFRYLRQSVVCCGDTALEGQNLKVSKPDTDGTGATHLCKDFEQIRAWAEERRKSDVHSI